MLFPLEEVELKKYLKFDLIPIGTIPFLLTECKPVELNDFLLSYYLFPGQSQIFEMAKASVTVNKIKGHGSDLSFAATPMDWIDWAVSKELEIPKPFRELYQGRQKQQEQVRLRSNETYRPEEESRDKFAAQQVMKVIREFIPDLPIAQLIRVPPIKKIASKYTLVTLRKWVNEAAIKSKQGNITKETKEKCIARMPKEWAFQWESDKSASFSAVQKNRNKIFLEF